MPRLKSVKRLYHVSPRVNRVSIRQHGLDWTRMTTAQMGIAGSTTPEEEGIFLVQNLSEAHWYCGFGQPGRVVDVWAVDVSGLRVEWHDAGDLICRKTIPPKRLSLAEVREVVAPFESRPVADDGG